MDDHQQIQAVEAEMPKPTIWPAALAVGLVAASFGMVTVGIFFYAGVGLVVVAITGWMRDLIEAGDVAQAIQPAAEHPASE